MSGQMGVGMCLGRGKVPRRVQDGLARVRSLSGWVGNEGVKPAKETQTVRCGSPQAVVTRHQTEMPRAEPGRAMEDQRGEAQGSQGRGGVLGGAVHATSNACLSLIHASNTPKLARSHKALCASIS